MSNVKRKTNGRGTALITGASSGIGRAYAEALAAQGHDLLLIARRQDRLSQLCIELSNKHNITADFLVADLSDPMARRPIVDAIKARNDIKWLVNNAGFGTMGRFGQVEWDKQTSMIELHITAVVELCNGVLPQMLARQSGTIINVSSIAAFLPGPHNVNYGATKAYVNSFSQALQIETAEQGIRVQALCPGFTRTEFHSTAEFTEFNPKGVPNWLWMTAEKTAQHSLEAIAAQKQVVFIPGWNNRLFVWLNQAVWLRRLVRPLRQLVRFLRGR